MNLETYAKNIAVFIDMENIDYHRINFSVLLPSRCKITDIIKTVKNLK